jgi:hypothetical protein
MAENLEAFTGHLGLGTNSAGTVEPTSSIPGAFPKDAPPSPVRAPVAVAGMFTNDRGDLEKSNQWFVDHAKDEGIVVIKVTKIAHLVISTVYFYTLKILTDFP